MERSRVAALVPALPAGAPPRNHESVKLTLLLLAAAPFLLWPLRREFKKIGIRLERAVSIARERRLRRHLRHVSPVPVRPAPPPRYAFPLARALQQCAGVSKRDADLAAAAPLFHQSPAAPPVPPYSNPGSGSPPTTQP